MGPLRVSGSYNGSTNTVFRGVNSICHNSTGRQLIVEDRATKTFLAEMTGGTSEGGFSISSIVFPARDMLTDARDPLCMACIRG